MEHPHGRGRSRYCPRRGGRRQVGEPFLGTRTWSPDASAPEVGPEEAKASKGLVRSWPSVPTSRELLTLTSCLRWVLGGPDSGEPQRA